MHYGGEENMTLESVEPFDELILELGMLRRSIAVHLGALCVAYGIDLDDSFAQLLPGLDDELIEASSDIVKESQDDKR
jgi:hypothetical protein